MFNFQHMKKILDKLKALTSTEMLLLGTVILLIVLIVYRWDWISNEVAESFSNLFKSRN